jgi:hypothetical protein
MNFMKELVNYAWLFECSKYFEDYGHTLELGF